MTKNKYCSPRTKNRVAGCFTLKDLQEMADALDIPSNRSAKQLYDDIADIMKYDAPCEDDFCWMQSPKLVKFANKLEKRFRPSKEIITQFIIGQQSDLSHPQPKTIEMEL